MDNQGVRNLRRHGVRADTHRGLCSLVQGVGNRLGLGSHATSDQGDTVAIIVTGGDPMCRSLNVPRRRRLVTVCRTTTRQAQEEERTNEDASVYEITHGRPPS